MTAMGTHSKPVNGVVTNGHAPSLAPFAIPAALEVRQGGPVAPWPQPAEPDKWRHVMSASRAVLAHRGWLAAIPVILVNAVAFGAQLGFWRVHVPLMFEAVLVALALESIAIYLAWLAHLAQLADDSALRLRLAAYGMAVVIGALNYSHFMAPGWRPTVEAVTFGMMSVISPWLWSAHSRRVSRDALMALNKIEPHAVRLGATRWTWHPWRCVRVMSRATWVGENDPARAIALFPAKTSEEASSPPAGTPDARQDDGQDDGSTASEEPDISMDKTTAGSADKPQDIPVDIDMDKPQARRPPRKTVTGLDRAADIIRRNPGFSNAEVAKRARVSGKTVSRARAKGQE